MDQPRPLDLSRPLWGRDLRHAALAIVSRSGQASVKEVLAALRARGFSVWGRQANKVLADAMGHEVKRGRLRRTGWGRYAVGRLAKTTRWRVRRRWDLARASEPEVLDQPVPGRPAPARPSAAEPLTAAADVLPADWWRSFA
jgi:hypothetical protein